MTCISTTLHFYQSVLVTELLSRGDHQDPEVTKGSKDFDVGMSTFSKMEDLLALANRR